MVVYVKKMVANCDTNKQGDIIKSQILENLRADLDTVLDFSGVYNVTTSFVNSAFIEVLDDIDVHHFKDRVKILGASRQVANLIKSRVNDASKVVPVNA